MDGRSDQPAAPAERGPSGFAPATASALRLVTLAERPDLGTCFDENVWIVHDLR